MAHRIISGSAESFRDKLHRKHAFVGAALFRVDPIVHRADRCDGLVAIGMARATAGAASPFVPTRH